MDKLQDPIGNLEAQIPCSITEGLNAIKTGRTEFTHAKRTIISLRRNIKGRVGDLDHMVDDAHIELNDSLQKVERDLLILRLHHVPGKYPSIRGLCRWEKPRQCLNETPRTGRVPERS